MSREIHVFGAWQQLGELQLLGLLRAEVAHGTETFSFEYSREWLEGNSAMSLDPELRLFRGPQYSSDNNRPNFGLFLDSSPDRWGQLSSRSAFPIAMITCATTVSSSSQTDGSSRQPMTSTQTRPARD